MSAEEKNEARTHALETVVVRTTHEHGEERAVRSA